MPLFLSTKGRYLWCDQGFSIRFAAGVLRAESSGAGFIGVLSGAYREEDWRELSEDIMLLPTVSQLVDLI